MIALHVVIDLQHHHVVMLWHILAVDEQIHKSTTKHNPINVNF